MTFRAIAAQSATAAALCMTVCLGGCGYVVGGGFDRNIRTVHVPTFTSDSFRRNLAEQLTEAVHKEIQLRTPYRLVTSREGADTRLVGHIVEVRKDVLAENSFDDPRNLQLTLACEVRWEDTRTGRVLSSRQVPLSGRNVDLVSLASFAPEVGQSRATAEQELLSELARDVVNLMETPW